MGRYAASFRCVRRLKRLTVTPCGQFREKKEKEEKKSTRTSDFTGMNIITTEVGVRKYYKSRVGFPTEGEVRTLGHRGPKVSGQ